MAKKKDNRKFPYSLLRENSRVLFQTEPEILDGAIVDKDKEYTKADIEKAIEVFLKKPIKFNEEKEVE